MSKFIAQSYYDSVVVENDTLRALLAKFTAPPTEAEIDAAWEITCVEENGNLSHPEFEAFKCGFFKGWKLLEMRGI